MKKIIVGILCLCAPVFSNDISDVKDVRPPKHVRDEDYEEIADRVTDRVAKQFREEKLLNCIGTGGRMMNDIQMMSMNFLCYNEVSLSVARQLLIIAVREYLSAINESKEIRPYLHNYPFREQDVEIRIWIQDPKDSSLPTDRIVANHKAEVNLAQAVPEENGLMDKKNDQQKIASQLPKCKINYISSINSVFRYQVKDESKTSEGKELHKETYEEAFRIMREEYASQSKAS